LLDQEALDGHMANEAHVSTLTRKVERVSATAPPEVTVRNGITERQMSYLKKLLLAKPDRSVAESIRKQLNTDYADGILTKAAASSYIESLTTKSNR
jgi:hypothetical protein